MVTALPYKTDNGAAGMPGIILDLCGGTGAWSRPYKLAEYDVRLITLPEYDVCDYIPPGNIYGILAAPPCTEFSLAKNGSHRKRDLESGMRVVKAVMEIVWRCRLDGHLKFWALENPVGYLRQFLGIPNFTFEQWEFGGNKRKRTDVWGYFNEPKKTCKSMPPKMSPEIYGKGRGHGYDWSVPKAPAWLDPKGLTRADLRSITPDGFAQAFFRANK
ncbi:MAG: hypothetical protein LBI86_09700 [Treponema sp.]|nr:hypothetical protein [Treponema sp.]